MSKQLYGFQFFLSKVDYCSNDKYIKAEIRVCECRLENNYNNAVFTTPIFSIHYQAHRLTENDVDFRSTRILPDSIQHPERYTEWYAEKVVPEAMSVHYFGEQAKEIQSILTKLIKTQERFNLRYRYTDPLECMLYTLCEAKIGQLLYDRGLSRHVLDTSYTWSKP